MAKRHYDFVFSLGAACSCSQALRLANLQFASFPCDWLYGGTPVVRAQGLADGFRDWPARQKALKYAQYNATGWWQYAVNRTVWRLYRHFRRAVERRGLQGLGR